MGKASPLTTSLYRILSSWSLREESNKLERRAKCLILLNKKNRKNEENEDEKDNKIKSL